MTVIVIARWQTTQEHVDEVISLVTELRRLSSQEPGCVGYEAFRGVDEPTVITLVERYRDSAAQEAHRDSEHFRDLVLGRIVPLLTDRRVEIVEEVGT